MTSVRQEWPAIPAGKALRASRATAKSRRTEASGKATSGRIKPPRRKGQETSSTTKVAQVRLQPDEVAALDAVVRRLNLGSTSEALREGLRLLVREAAEVQAAEEIRAFYEGERVPLPDGVAPATEAELKAADEAQW